METLDYRYVYRRTNEPKLEPALAYLESELGGVRKPFDGRKGAIDLVTILEIAIGVIVGKYFEGLFNGDGLKGLGESHRRQIMSWLAETSGEIQKTVKAVEPLLTLRPEKLHNDAIALTLELGSKILYIVLNHHAMSRSLLSNLPAGIMATLQFFIEHPIPDNSQIFQLYFDKITKRWKFLFAPSPNGFGRVIDRYIDLDTNGLYWIKSRREFVEMFRPETNDEFKFLVSPFRQQDFV